MKGKRMGLAGVGIAVLLLGAAGYWNHVRNHTVFIKNTPSETMQEENFVSDELIGTADSEEQAKQTARLYGIELVEYLDGIALYRTQEDPRDIIKLGEENGYPPLALNYLRSTGDK